jgi:exosortase/archaeosortase family protein
LIRQEQEGLATLDGSLPDSLHSWQFNSNSWMVAFDTCYRLPGAYRSIHELTGIPVFRDGLYFSLPTGNWSVIEARSGLNYLIASLTLGVLYSYLTYRSLKKRLIFVLAITLFSIIANGLRAYGIVIIGHLTNMNSGISGDHAFWGWLFYGFFVFWIFYLGNIWADKPLLIQQTSTENNLASPGSSPIALFVIIFSVMVSIQMLARETTHFNRIGLDGIGFYLPDNFGGWQYSPTTDLGWKPQIVGASITKVK